MSIGLKEIASKAGVSRMTVSRALRNHPGINPSTRDRIVKIAENLGYRPNPLVSVWMSRVAGSKKTVFMPSLAYLGGYRDTASREEMILQRSPFGGASNRAEQLGFRLEEQPLFTGGMSPERASKILYARSCPGVVVGPLEEMATELDFIWEYFALVAIGYTLRTPELHRVVVNHSLGMTLTLDALRDLGKRRIGLVLKTLSDDRTEHRWTSAYLGYLWHHPELTILPPFVSPRLDRQLFSEWFRQHRPDAIIGADPELIDWFLPLDRRTQKKRCVFIHLDGSFADDPRIFGAVTASRERVGAAAIDILIGQIKRNERGIPDSPRLTLVPCEFQLLAGAADRG